MYINSRNGTKTWHWYNISIAPKWSKYLVVKLFKNAISLSYQGGALPTELH